MIKHIKNTKNYLRKKKEVEEFDIDNYNINLISQNQKVKKF